MSHPLPATPEGIMALLAPFVFQPPVYGPGRTVTSKPKTHAVDLIRSTSGFCHKRIDADIRGFTDEGVSVFFYNSCEVVPWDQIDIVKVRAVAKFGETLATIEYRKENAL